LLNVDERQEIVYIPKKSAKVDIRFVCFVLHWDDPNHDAPDWALGTFGESPVNMGAHALRWFHNL